MSDLAVFLIGTATWLFTGMFVMAVITKLRWPTDDWGLTAAGIILWPVVIISHLLAYITEG
jgi:hypothetical protein